MKTVIFTKLPTSDLVEFSTLSEDTLRRKIIILKIGESNPSYGLLTRGVYQSGDYFFICLTDDAVEGNRWNGDSTILRSITLQANSKNTANSGRSIHIFDDWIEAAKFMAKKN